MYTKSVIINHDARAQEKGPARQAGPGSDCIILQVSHEAAADDALQLALGDAAGVLIPDCALPGRDGAAIARGVADHGGSKRECDHRPVMAAAATRPRLLLGTLSPQCRALACGIEMLR